MRKQKTKKNKSKSACKSDCCVASLPKKSEMIADLNRKQPVLPRYTWIRDAARSRGITIAALSRELGYQYPWTFNLKLREKRADIREYKWVITRIYSK